MALVVPRYTEDFFAKFDEVAARISPTGAEDIFQTGSRGWSVRKVVSLLCALLSLAACSVCAQEAPSGPSSAGGAQSDALAQARVLIEQAAKAGVKLSEEQQRSIIESQHRYQEITTELSWSQAEPEVRSRVLSHTKGKQGVPFPSSDLVVLEPIPTPTPDLTPQQPEATPTPFPSPTPYVRPGRCERNETIREEFPPMGTGEETYSDYIYIAEDLIPLDPQEVFGEKVTLYPYGSDHDSATDIRIKIDRVPCLPYRMRMTNLARYYDTGVN
ncbi:MAG: hypothetical protein ACK5Y6_01580, partial [Pseudomonadota bacterium]